jgi:glycosyltransferase involved in cell wall biosynthesis
MPLLSVIIPTRDSVQNLEKLFLDSVAKNTYNINNIELVFVADKDDSETIHFLKNNEFIKSLKHVKVIIRKQSNNITKDYYNVGAKQSTGFFVMVGADDIQITTPEYDKILEKIKQGIIQEEGHDKKYFLLVETNSDVAVGEAGACPFPIITRDSIDLLGYFLGPEIIPGWGPDWYIHKIYDTVNKVATPRVPISIQHRSVHSGNITEKSKGRYSKMKTVSALAPNAKHNPQVYVEMIKAIFLIIAEDMEQYTPHNMHQAFTIAGTAPDTALAANINQPQIEKCPKVFLEAIFGVKQAVHNNLKKSNEFRHM